MANAEDVVCVDWAAGQSAGGIGAYQVDAVGPSTARIKCAIGVPLAAVQDLLANTEYFSMNLTINNAKTVGTGACSGCDVPACIALTRIKITTSGGANDVTLTTPAGDHNSNNVFWQGGGGTTPLPSGACSDFDTAGFAVSTIVLGRGVINRSRYKDFYPPGSPLTLSAVASPGDRFVAWSGDTTTTRDSISFTVYRELTYFANFDRDPAAAPVLTMVSDIPDDQGTHTRTTWNRSPIDDAAYPGQLCCYWIERRLNSSPLAPWVAASGLITPNYSPTYSQVVVTPADSTESDPAILNFRVVMQASSGSALWFSNELPGYSVDNIAPPPPASVSGVMTTGTATLFWPAVSVADFAHYAIYRGLENPPPTDAAHRVGTTTATNFGDSPGYFAYYAVTTVDVHGNQSPAVPFVPLNAVGVAGSAIPKTLSVGHPVPSPMASSMSLRLGLPDRMRATVEILDSQGRMVRQLSDGEQPAGWLTVSWDAKDARGGLAAAGMYFVRVRTPQGTTVRRLALVP
jgi:hypothetical protein